MSYKTFTYYPYLKHIEINIQDDEFGLLKMINSDNIQQSVWICALNSVIECYHNIYGNATGNVVLFLYEINYSGIVAYPILCKSIPWFQDFEKQVISKYNLIK